ncbi:hypothetical protein AWB71_06044 [Caballeronia peredens]|nr:hypothetical protein AWB71_06044 [Caballeronia peredens]
MEVSSTIMKNAEPAAKTGNRKWTGEDEPLVACSLIELIAAVPIAEDASTSTA